MNKKALYILAPNDRFNYGDLIFPYIIKHYIGSLFDDIHYVSTTKSNLSDLGGIPTESYDVLYNADGNQYDNYLIIAGGESLFVSWSEIILFVDKRYLLMKKILLRLFFFRKSIGLKMYKRLFKLIFAPKTQYPFTVGKYELSNFNGIYYNSVGGFGLLSPERLSFLRERGGLAQNILTSSDYISVRDNLTHKALSLSNINNKLAADSAILMSDVFSDIYIKDNIKIEQQRISEPYIFFQGGVGYLRKYAKEISEQIYALQQETKLSICLCPIGTAIGHEDHIGLNILEPYLNRSGVNYFKIDNPNIYDIMYLLKNATLYIGSSLHGVITSMSFKVPYVGYGPKKLHAYIKTWGDDLFYTSDIQVIYDKGVSALKSKCITDSLLRQKESVIHSLELISKLATK